MKTHLIRQTTLSELLLTAGLTGSAWAQAGTNAPRCSRP